MCVCVPPSPPIFFCLSLCRVTSHSLAYACILLPFNYLLLQKDGTDGGESSSSNSSVCIPAVEHRLDGVKAQIRGIEERRKGSKVYVILMTHSLRFVELEHTGGVH